MTNSTLDRDRGFTTPHACRIAGLKYRTADAWARTGFLEPSLAPGGPGRGKGRRWSFTDLVRLRVARELRARGVPLQNLREVVARLRTWQPPQDLANARLVVAGRRAHLVTDRDTLLDVLTGQASFAFVLSLAPLVRDVERKVRAAA